MTSSHNVKYLQVTWNDNVSLIFVLMEMRYENKWKWNGTRKEKWNEKLSEWYTSHEMFTDVCYLVDEPFSVYQITFLSYYMTHGCKNNWKNEAKPGHIVLWKRVKHRIRFSWRIAVQLCNKSWAVSEVAIIGASLTLSWNNMWGGAFTGSGVGWFLSMVFWQKRIITHTYVAWHNKVRTRNKSHHRYVYMIFYEM